MNIQKVEEQAKEPQVTSSGYRAGVINNPCGHGKCVSQDIDPKHFLSECCAPVCWDCWFVSQKIIL